MIRITSASASLVTQAFNARAIEAMRPRIRAITEQLLDAVGNAADV